MKRFIGTGGGICCLAAALLLAMAGWGCSSQQNRAAAPETASVEGMIYFAAPNGAVTIIPPQEAIEEAPRAVIRADSQTRILRDQKPATYNNLKAGDAVRARYVPATGAAILIRAASR